VDLGGRIEQAIEQFSQLGALGGQNPEQLLDQLEAQLGIDPRRDLASWMGDAGVFAFGDTPAELGGGLVVAVKDQDAARAAMPRIVRFLRRVGGVSAKPLSRGGIDTGFTLSSPALPLPVHLALTDQDRMIVAVTDAALAQALKATDDRLGDSAPFKEAAGRLGEGMEPMAFLNFAPLAGLVDATGAGSDPNVKKARDGLERLTTLVIGAKREGDSAAGKLIVGVK
jgi:hypothetical protein